MKKQFFRCAFAFIPAMALFTGMHAQSYKSTTEPGAIAYFNEAAGYAGIDEASTGRINNRALKDFGKSFKNAVNTDWWKIKDGFQARFEATGIKTRVFYDHHGRWSSTILTYGKEKLPKDVLKQVRSIYYDFDIYLVNEVTTGEATAYLVYIQDAFACKTIRITDDTMDVYEEFNKLP